ncbi:hypothetical protein B0H66DRAFT_562412 [Apodospora peruviana]|uniref:TMEM205-like domain-containing protein n=1 Tax=Apodospora peruviana TaxID=516989 RepID=A0AAE0I1Q7_9PEZI|nr:hypothetical protein B0H66DRAFT_562412 [Apodospora peruviana]
MSITDTLSSLAASLVPPIHFLLYSTLLGTELYQSFFMTKVCFVALPRSAFTTLQKRVFPIYFRAQAGLLFLVALTFPARANQADDAGRWLASAIPLSAGHKSDWIPFAVAGLTSVLNLVVYEPRTRMAMVERIHQETRDAKRRAVTNENDGHKSHGLTIGESSGPSDEMRRLNRLFSKNHAMSIHLNLVSMGAMLLYGLRLASRLNLEAV